MLRKLLKYELKATARIFMPIYLVLIVFAFINHFMSFNASTFSVPQGITLTLYIIILVGMFVATFIVMIQRFYKNLLSEEGYLMFTLPVRTWKHTLCKLLVSIMWIILSSIAALASIIIIALQEATLSEMFQGLGEVWDFVYSAIGTSIYQLIALMVVGYIISIITGILYIYLAIAIGNLSNNHKTLASVGAFLGIYTISEIISSLVLVGADGQGPINMLLTEQYSQIPFGFLWLTIALSAIFGVIYFFVTNLILSRHLNLE